LEPGFPISWTDVWPKYLARVGTREKTGLAQGQKQVRPSGWTGLTGIKEAFGQLLKTEIREVKE